MTSQLTIRELDNWEIATWFGNGDPLVLAGDIYNHPNIDDGDRITPSMFVAFNPVTKEGVTATGTAYRLLNFVPNGNAPTEEDALDWITENWVKV